MGIQLGGLMVDPDFAEQITLRRPRSTAFANEGVATVTYEPDCKVLAVVQPAKPSDAHALPEGVSLTDVVSIWSLREIRVAGDDNTMSDVFIVHGRSYRVFQLEDRAKNGYWRALAQRYEP